MSRRLLAVALVSLTACRGEVVARAPLSSPGTVEVAIPDLERPRTLSVWADCDADWTGRKSSKPEVSYAIEFLQSGKVVGHAACSTNQRGGVSICGGTRNVMGDHSGDCEYLLDCELPELPPKGVTARVTASVGANVSATRSLSLNFRAK